MFNKNLKLQKGVIALFTMVLVLAILLIILGSLEFLTALQQRIYRNSVRSLQTYYVAESGIEDVLLKLKNDHLMPSGTYPLTIGSGAATVNVSDILGGARTITSQGRISNIYRKIQVVYKITTDSINFHYGAQVDDGGLLMDNNAVIYGNVYSNGDITNIRGGWSYIHGSVVTAQTSKIKNLKIGDSDPDSPFYQTGDAFVYSCEGGSEVLYGKLTYVSPGGSVDDCTAAGGVFSQEPKFPREELPIPSAKIDDWKQSSTMYTENDFVGNCLSINGDDVIVDGCEREDNPLYLGPVKIGTGSQPKNLIVKTGNYVELMGTIYVTGNITFENNSVVKLVSQYGNLSGIIIADGTITAQNTTFLGGSGQVGSYILVLSTYQLDVATPAIDVSNNTKGAIFYANNGFINLQNRMEAKEITGYQIKMGENAEIIYESGLENSLFTGGPGGTWNVASWKEIE